MRILFIADGRSPIALNWIEYFVQEGHEVHLASTYPCAPNIGLESLIVIPIAIGLTVGGLKENVSSDFPEQLPVPVLGEEIKQKRRAEENERLSFSLPAASKKSLLRDIMPVSLRTAIRQRLMPGTLPSASRKLKALIASIQPDLIHAMRIPYEGMLAALADPPCPLVISVWGNDFTLHAPTTRALANLTRQTLQRADALHTDCERDRKLAFAWGYAHQKPTITLPGAGGVKLDVFNTKLVEKSRRETQPLIINPRGVRAYVRNDIFFHAIPQILAQKPEARFICPGMAGESQILDWVEKLDISRAVTLLPRLNRADMATLFNQAVVSVSLTEHDGTPNTLLEAMACGCFPVAGDIETLREWITPGINGLLVPPDDSQAVANAVLSALSLPELRQRAYDINISIIKERADYTKIMPKALSFYLSLISST